MYCVIKTVGYLLIECTHEIDHLDGIDGTVITLIAGLGTCPLDRLFDAVGCEYAEHDGNTIFERNAGDTFGDFAADIIIVARGTADDSAETDDGIIIATLSHLLSDDRNLECTGDPCN